MTVLNLSDELGDASRARLAELADVLIPGGSGLPSASAADVAGQWINRVLAAHAGLAEAVAQVLAIPGAPDEVLRNLDREAFETFAFAVAGAYFMNPTVRNALGYPGIAPRRMPSAEGEAEYYLEDGILNPVIERGPIYRQAPA
ncbi:hypothetical protein HC028_26435 [Planosporangium flavigriseum]|uniref:Gluconate 2-dehydrogenase subunit 3 n=1 Tax=Planosporangium flavigriseum TaxID=373681 RepID=A0A8J3LTS5_9ACTN|nr:hypothetical protein [Planosporangium flavigriseum]NJC68017.1 hypothetical protein [Planosporangium flavigriseum]GIG76640.1 hypothetical protein Pfl04_50440 [Planosporangium flavigriseum]